MAILTHGSPNFRIFCEREGSLFLGISAAPVLPQRVGVYGHFVKGRGTSRRLSKKELCDFPGKGSFAARNIVFTVPRDSSSSNTSSSSSKDDPSNQSEQTPFGYTRKDVLFIGLGVTILGFGLKSGLEFAGYDPMQAGNVVQLVLVLGLTLGWVSTYMFRVSNKDMTYAQQLRDYEDKVMQKRLESLTEAELVALLEQVEEEKSQSASGEQVN
ncbi:uncharacterized protein LOC111006814 [Momordica charantia]|uniref:Uncharacterized protein LOC111006814 n=1 Tax=Momordica charantia TaxID=3673 RepID=A0A6J1C000_MOMCH|nr:uncharacterized protein LOC111006814 [Momordica charantia]